MCQGIYVLKSLKCQDTEAFVFLKKQKTIQLNTYFYVKITSGPCSLERIVQCFLSFFAKFKPSQLLSPPLQDRRAKHWQFDLPSQVTPVLTAAGPVWSLLVDQSQPAPGPV